MEVELTQHVGYEPHCEPPGGARQPAQWHDAQDADLRAREGPDRRSPRSGRSFEPQIVCKGQRRFVGFDDKILALYNSC